MHNAQLIDNSNKTLPPLSSHHQFSQAPFSMVQLCADLLNDYKDWVRVRAWWRFMGKVVYMWSQSFQ